MREIKFRAWNTIEKKMEYYPMILPKRAGGGYAVSGDGHRYVLMQYTGMKDRNGAEIYEGDIVLNEHGHTCEMVFRHHGFYYTRPGWKSRLAHPTEGTMQVIGNIYENPELLINGQ